MTTEGSSALNMHRHTHNQHQRHQSLPQLQVQSLPHHSHADPWAHNFICCDGPHSASTSMPGRVTTPAGTSNLPGGMYSLPNSAAPSPISATLAGTSQAQAGLALKSAPPNASCEGDTGCCTEAACGPVECCTDPTCAAEGCDQTHQHQHHAAEGQAGQPLDDGDELMRWACSKEGCEAIQQYLECCTLPDCSIPTVPPPNEGSATVSVPAANTVHYHVSGGLNGALSGHSAAQGFTQHAAAASSSNLVHNPNNSFSESPASGLSGPTSVAGLPLQNISSFSSLHTGRSHTHRHTHSHAPHLAHVRTHGHVSQFPSASPQQHQQLYQPSTPVQFPSGSSTPYMQQHQHRHHHTHSTSISSIPHSTITSPDILPWSTVLTPASTGSQTTPASSMHFPTHICHWQNCHLTFSSMPDLLAHVAADHLGAPGFGPSNPLPPQPSPSVTQISPGFEAMLSTQSGGAAMTPPQVTQQRHLHTLSQSLSLGQTASLLASGHALAGLSGIPSTSASTPSTGSSLPDLAALGFHSVSDPTQIQLQAAQAQAQAQAQAEQDRLLSCLWDDCFPLPTECSADQPDQCPPHVHIPAPADCNVTHPHSHTHTHANPSGEPFSPQTMLRHVLEEHLGVPSDILGWNAFNAEFGLESLAAGLAANPANTPELDLGSMAGLDLPPSAMLSQLDTDVKNSPARDGSSSPLLGATASPLKPLMCGWHNCSHPRPFATPSELMDHLSEVHIGRGKDAYACMWGDCLGQDGEGRLFRSRQKVLRHLQSHTGYRPFICPVCDQAFSEAAPLAAHLRRHKEEKPFVCDHPGCGKTFAISSSLTIHMRTHNGEKPFICPHCSKGFVEASNLTKHIRTHTGERPFACPEPGCDKRFPRPDQLKRHMAIHDRERDKLSGEGKSRGHVKGKGGRDGRRGSKG